MSPLILDDLGLVFDSATEYDNYAASIGKVATALTDAEKKQSLMSATIRVGTEQIKAAGGITDSAADSFRQMGASMADAKVSFAAHLVDLGTGIGLWPTLAGWAKEYADQIKRARDLKGFEKQAAQISQDIGGDPAMLLEVLKAESMLPLILKGAGAAVNAVAAAELPVLTTAQAIADKWADILKAATEMANIPWSDVVRGMIGTTSGNVFGPGAEDDYTYGTRYKLNALKVLGVKEDDLRKEGAAADKRATDRWLSDRQAAAQQMQSTLEGMFTATSGIDVTGMRDQMGDHVQTWDEDRRRMLAVAQGGLANEWAKTFAIPEEVLKGGDKAVRAWALDMVKAFDEGAPSATAAGMKYDVGAVVQQYKDMAANKALQRQLAQEAAKQLGSEGITVDTGIMAQISGQAEGITAADVLGKDPFKGIGATAIDVFKAELTGQAEEIAKAGAGFMGVFIDAAKKAGKESEFMTNMMNTLIPGLLAELQRRGLLRGPAGAYP